MRISIIFAFIFLLSCSDNKDTIDIRDFNREIGFQAITNISQEFKTTGLLDSISNYKFFGSVVDKSSLEIQLWSKFNLKSYQRNDVVVYVYEKNAYAIPILTNEYNHYWQFIEDSTDNFHSLPKTTFLKEFGKMLDTLGISDSNMIANSALITLFSQILQSRIIHESDSSEIIERIESNYSKAEPEFACLKRKSAILKTVYYNINKPNRITHYNAFWDINFHRIYQVDYDSMRLSKRFNPRLEIHNLECFEGPLMIL